MNSLIMPVILFVTVVASVGFGILAAYAAVIGILHAFGRPLQPEAGSPASGLGSHAEPRQRRLGGFGASLGDAISATTSVQTFASKKLPCPTNSLQKSVIPTGAKRSGGTLVFSTADSLHLGFSYAILAGQNSNLPRQDISSHQSQISIIMSSRRVGYLFSTSPLSLRTTTVSEWRTPPQSGS